MKRIIIRDKEGDPVYSSRNLRGLRDFIGKGNLIKVVAIDLLEHQEGLLSVLFENGYSCQVNFASFFVLKNTVRNWRNMYGAPLVVNGVEHGSIEYKNWGLATGR
jgi:hypothetical protein